MGLYKLWQAGFVPDPHVSLGTEQAYAGSRGTDRRNKVNTLHANKRCGALSYCGVLHFPTPSSSLLAAHHGRCKGQGWSSFGQTTLHRCNQSSSFSFAHMHVLAVTALTEIANLQDISSKPHQPMAHT